MRLSIALLLAVLIAGCDRQKAESPQAEAPKTEHPSQVGTSGKLDRSRAGRAAPDVQFLDPDGQEVSLAAFKGKPLLLNLWATWCAPCVAEMPSLDALAARSSNVQVLAVSQDIAGQEAKVVTFFDERRLSKLEPYRDPELALMASVKADVLPTTILYDADGKEVWRMTGAADWTGPETAKLLAAAR